MKVELYVVADRGLLLLYSIQSCSNWLVLDKAKRTKEHKTTKKGFSDLTNRYAIKSKRWNTQNSIKCKMIWDMYCSYMCN